MAMNIQKIQHYGDELYDALISRVAVDPLTNREPEISIDDAYQIQLRMIERRLHTGETVVGKKNRRHQQSRHGYVGREPT
jgi:2-oxopent-4-enoate/cis-2-oxohex-4-enoate hydratase